MFFPRQQRELQLTADQQIDVLRRSWQSHDAGWQMAIFQRYGWDEGNRLNKEVARQIGKGAMHRLMKHLGITGVKDIDEFRRIIDITTALFYPKPDFDYQFEQLSDTKVVAIVRQCVICDNVIRGGVAKFYECGCFAMQEGWYDALGVDVERTLGKCLKAGDDRCEITLHVKSWGNPRDSARSLK